MDSASQRTTYPSVTGGSVVAVKYNGGVLVAADTIMSYGTLAKFDGVVRMAPVGAKGQVLLSAGGDYSDYQQMLKIINSSAVEEYTMDDGAVMSASAMHHWLTRIMYQRRSKMDPLWNAVVIAGVGGDGQSYLGTTDMYGTMYADNFIVSAHASSAKSAHPLLPRPRPGAWCRRVARPGWRAPEKASREEAVHLAVGPRPSWRMPSLVRLPSSFRPPPSPAPPRCLLLARAPAGDGHGRPPRPAVAAQGVEGRPDRGRGPQGPRGLHARLLLPLVHRLQQDHHRQGERGRLRRLRHLLA